MTTRADAEDPPEMSPTEFLFRVGMVLGQSLAPQPRPTLPMMAPGQRVIQMWSEPDWQGYRQLLTFEVRER